MPPRIAISMPHGVDLEYAEQAIPQYERAVRCAGGEPVRIGLHQSADEITSAIEACQGVLLPGSKADVDPARFHAQRSSHTAADDPLRERVDNLLLDDAYEQRKPILGICYGLQSLNVYRGGSLVQHIPDFLPEATRSRVNHDAGKKVVVAHAVEIESRSLLASIVVGDRHGAAGKSQILVPVNSSHHQSADAIGDGLHIVSRCPEDGIIEALEGTGVDQFVLAVQWHPERSLDDESSRAIFCALVAAAEEWRS